MSRINVYQAIDRNRRNTWLLMSGFIVILAVLGFAFDYFLQSGGDVFTGFLIFAFIWTLISYFASARVTLFLNGARKAQRGEYPYLVNIVEALSLAAGIPTPEIYVIETGAMNAFATGRSPEKSYVVFTTGLLEKLDRQEIEAVAAHEIAHIKNYDIRVQTIAVMLAGFIVMIADLVYRMFLWGGYRSRDREERGNSALGIIVLLVVSLVAAVFAELLKLAVSRQREYLADATAALTTKNPEALASALEKIAADNTPFRYANQATAHLYIASPFKKRSIQKTFSSLFSTHPPIEDRIQRLRSM